MQQNIYFRKDVWDKLKDEPEKSKLINTLLDRHYSEQPGAVQRALDNNELKVTPGKNWTEVKPQPTKQTYPEPPISPELEDLFTWNSEKGMWWSVEGEQYVSRLPY